MSKKFKSQASSSRAAAGGFNAFGGSFGGFQSAFSSQGKEPSSLTYVAEPPDLSRISEPQLVIAFKNILKKDEITRTKAVDDLQEHIGAIESRGGTLDDGFLEAWIKIYPRTSIDLSRRVRQTAHSIQGSVASLVGKRIARHLPKVIGAWLAGLYDTDRPVVRAALESFTRVFSTEEKRSSVWKIYQSSILDFVDDVLLQQTALTLSDERTVKPDDAEAKYARVVGTALSLFNRVLGSSAEEDLQKDESTIQNLLGSKSLWAFGFHEDPFVRRCLYALLRSTVSKKPGELDWRIVSASLIGKSLALSQLGSSTELSGCLLEVTSSRPQLWTTDYIGKSSPSKRLIQYIQKGSQGGLGSFWTNLTQLLRTVPLQVLAKNDSETEATHKISLSNASSLLEAFQEGLYSREEPRQNLVIGWKSYTETCVWLLSLLAENDKKAFIEGSASPILRRYLISKVDEPSRALPSQFAEAICSDIFATLAKDGYTNELQPLWAESSDKLLEAVKLSSPEQSKDFKPSQDAICSQGKRLFALESTILTRLSGTEFESQALDLFQKTGLPLIESCLQVLGSRNGKPYGAAAVAEESICYVPQIARRSQKLLAFVTDEAPELLFSPSGDRLFAMILACRSWEGFGSSYENVVERVIELGPEQPSAPILQKLLSTLQFNEVVDKAKLNSVIMQALDRALKGSQQQWTIIVAVLGNITFRGELTDSLFLKIIESLSVDGMVLDSLFGLSQIADTVPSAIRDFQSGPNGAKLTSKLLYLSESLAEESAGLADTLVAKLRGLVAGDASTTSNLAILQHSFDEVNYESLSIESLLGIAEELLRTCKTEDKEHTVKGILPPAISWEKALSPFLNLPPRPSMALTSPLGGVVHLINSQVSEDFQQKWNAVPRDSSNCSSAFRLFSYTTRIASSSEVVELLGEEDLQTLLYYVPLAVQLVDDDLSIEYCNGITGLELAEQRVEYMEVVADGWKLINTWIDSTVPHRGSQSVSSILATLWEDKLERLANFSPLAYRIGEAFVKIMTASESLEMHKTSDDLTKICRETRSANAIRSAAWFSLLQDKIVSLPAGTRLCNELIADSTGMKPQDEKNEGLRKLALANLLLSGDKETVASIPTQRLVFLVKNLVQCLQWEALSLGLKAEILKTLTLVLSSLSEIYGSHWEESMDIMNAIWTEIGGGDAALPVLASSFRLYICLERLAEGDGNDDVQDAWSEQRATLQKNLTSTLTTFDSSITFHQPRDLTVELLCRVISSIPVKNLADVSEVFPLLTANSRVIQRAAYELLHRYIPSVQEQVSFDVALSKTAVRLPDELLSLLLEPPTIDMIASVASEDKAWTQVRSYLLSWKVVFDHFSNASLPVQEHYVSNIKENDSLAPLLDFTFDFLQSAPGKFIDPSKLDIRSFEPDQSETAEKETQWLLVNLYYLALKYLANMTKSWWLDTTNRIRGPVESWSRKFISPLVIGDALQGVSEWISTQDANEERALSLKISSKTAEIIASIFVDEDSPPVAISISLPPAYPLQPALVVGRSRVLVDERNWKGWLLAIQGVIMFANGNLVDGLLAFRRNVQGALKGQSECAICYSVISTDMQTPNKRCATCKNTFHSVCLFRWFKSSNQSTCPLCRNNFVYV
ncbi:hypothetical protein ASPZODRAFT_128604 [Penicilliopsis zonata CBS 506.65]|uniref:E3 ubiquitin-protein ligase listerin n=1 Tax=Penicilliopsis zonata CBS 506.65 TaxID=1073090 RepID=A0A1L9SSD3_9EURO|nr:hypothetical protein ASPZODRAFT_128604 [Penicilliopsis zonata CBS 506.65]OJJ50016.1 hypothetical protein ASPZODRAFT_128604 [Penicilliopsis zonata CBS 506.65]